MKNIINLLPNISHNTLTTSCIYLSSFGYVNIVVKHMEYERLILLQSFYTFTLQIELTTFGNVGRQVFFAELLHMPFCIHAYLLYTYTSIHRNTRNTHTLVYFIILFLVDLL